MKSLQKKPDWALGEKEGKTKSTSEAPPEAHEARFLLHVGICQSFTKITFANTTNGYFVKLGHMQFFVCDCLFLMFVLQSLRFFLSCINTQNISKNRFSIHNVFRFIIVRFVKCKQQTYIIRILLKLSLKLNELLDMSGQLMLMSYLFSKVTIFFPYRLLQEQMK